jgi:hypothetical protein
MPCNVPAPGSLRRLIVLRWHLHRIRSARRLLELAEANDRVARELRAAALDIAEAEERALGVR